MSVFRKAAVYLGLVDDEDDEVYEYEDAVPDDGVSDRPLARPRATNDAAAGVVRPIREPQGAAFRTDAIARRRRHIGRHVGERRTFGRAGEGACGRAQGVQRRAGDR